jgi:hypothetical protein
MFGAALALALADARLDMHSDPHRLKATQGERSIEPFVTVRALATGTPAKLRVARVAELGIADLELCPRRDAIASQR